jgi:hypothetical protein
LSRDEELSVIERYLSTRKPTICPAAFVAPTSAGLSPAEESRRIAAIEVRKRSKQEFRAASNRFYLSLRP